MSKPWLASYPPGVPAEIDSNRYRSLAHMAEESFASFTERTAYVQMDKSLSFGELERQSRAFGAWLQHRAGIKRGDRVAIMMPNVLQYPIALFGVLRAGGTVVNTNPLYTARELRHQLVDSGAEVIVILENFAHVLEEVIGQTSVRKIVVTSVGELLGFPKGAIVDFVVRRVRKAVPAWNLPGAQRFNQVLAEGAALTLQPVDLTHDDLAFLQYTGGTTGVSKGAMLSHGNMVANVMQSSAWTEWALPQNEPGISITALPLYHIFALTANCIVFLRLGWTNILITNPRDFPGFVKELKKYPFTYIAGVNTLFNALLHTPGFEQVDFSKLRCSLGGGMAVQRAVAEHWKRVTGNVLTQAWGLTETSPGACINPIDEDFNESIGLPISSTEIGIADDAGNMLPIGEIGEICVRGPQVMKGYYNRPEETAKVMLPGGWLRTGDIGRMNDKGYVFIEDRKKDMINVSGFNVYPNEVEGVAVTHPGILEAAAVAKADEKSGEVVALFVVRKDPSLTEEDVIEHCRTALTGYKIPRHVYFRKELPKTNVGKILRRELRDEAQKL
ncbi:MAG: AMP-binding protein [Sinobacteraceae bacterium]|nr:AMP-binding protein [Nevskiaceae bacterium]